MDIEIDDMPIPALRELAKALEDVLDNRLHKRIYMGEPIVVKGSLSKALRLPDIQHRLESTHSDRREAGKAMLAELWATLSADTRNKTLEKLGWYDPKQLPWDDPRSNRKPALGDE